MDAHVTRTPRTQGPETRMAKGMAQATRAACAQDSARISRASSAIGEGQARAHHARGGVRASCAQPQPPAEVELARVMRTGGRAHATRLLGH